jgi:uncharacterized protein (DUF1015 family)
MNIFPFQAIFPKLDLVASTDSFFNSMKYQFNEYYNSGFFDKSAQEAFYIYEIRSPQSSYTGIVSCTDIRDLKNNKILKHEKTLAPKEQEMMRLILQRKAMIKPVLLAHFDNEDLNKFVAKIKSESKSIVSLDFENKETHNFWEVKDGAKVESLRSIFKEQIKKSYIADGHHRCSTTAILHNSQELENAKEKFGKILTVYIPFKQLKIWDYNRVVDVLGQTDLANFLVALSKYCKIKKIKKARKPKGKFEIIMFLQSSWFSIRWKAKIIDKHSSEKVCLDTNLFNLYILNKIAGIVDVREDKRVKYYSGTEPLSILEEEVNKNQNKIAFLIYPLLKEELVKVADDMKTVPPKSTWFEPRMKNGLITKEF